MSVFVRVTNREREREEKTKRRSAERGAAVETEKGWERPVTSVAECRRRERRERGKRKSS